MIQLLRKPFFKQLLFLAFLGGCLGMTPAVIFAADLVYGPYTFDADNDADESAWTFVSTNGTDGLNPSGTTRAWSHDVDNSPSSNIGPSSGQGGSPDGYIYTEASSPAAYGDTFYITHSTSSFDAIAYDWEVEFYWNQRGNSNLATVEVETLDDGGSWTSRATYAESGPDVGTGGLQIWNYEKLDLSSYLTTSSSSVRFKVTLGSSGTVWHNDFGLDTIVFNATATIQSAPSTTVSAVTGIGSSTATFNGEVTNSGAQVVTTRGFVYSTSSDLSTGVATTSETGSYSTGLYSLAVSNLLDNATYYVRAFATNASGTTYSATTSFTTYEADLSVETDAVTSISISSATLNGDVLGLGMPALTTRGFIYSTSSDLSTGVATTSETGSYTYGTYQLGINSLQASTTYYVRAFIQNASSIAYGSTQSFNTPLPPQLTTQAATTITFDGATLNGTVISDSGESLFRRGFRYSTSSDFSSNVATTTQGLFNVDAATFNSIALDVSSQEVDPEHMLFNDDGTSLYLLGSGGDDINEYTLSTEYDISTAVFDSIALSVSAQEAGASSMRFNDDGTSLYVMGTVGRDINEYTLSVAYDISTASFSDIALSVSGQELSPTDMLFNNNGTKLYVLGESDDDITAYTLSVAYDISTATFDKVPLDVSGQETNPRAMSFNYDGTSLYVTGYNGDDVNEYVMTTPYDIETATFSGIALNVSAQMASPRGIIFNDTGTQLYMVGSIDDEINQYDIPSFATGTFAQAVTGLAPDTTYYVQPFADNTVARGFGTSATFTTALAPPYVVTDAATDVSTSSVTFNGNITDVGDDTDASVRGFVYSTNASLATGVATTSQSGNYSTGAYSALVTGLSPGTLYYAKAFAENSNGRRYATGTILVRTTLTPPTLAATTISSVTNGGATLNSSVTDDGGLLVQRGFRYSSSSNFTSNVSTTTVSGPYNIATAVFDNVALNMGAHVLNMNPTALLFNHNGTVLYVLNDLNDEVVSYSLSSPYQVDNATYNGAVLDVSGEETSPTDMIFNDDGTVLYVVGIFNANVIEYPLSTPYVISTAATGTTALNVTTYEASPLDMLFNDDGTSLYIMGTAGDDINEYSLSSAYDVSSASFSQVALDVSSQEIEPRSMIFNDDGTKLYVSGPIGRDVNEYDLSSKYDVSTAVFSGIVLDVSAEETNGADILFNVDGTKLFLTGATGDDINEYSIASLNTGAYEIDVENLAANTTYYVQSIGKNSSGFGYGSTTSFTTPNVPTVVTDTTTSIDFNTATLNGEVTNSGGLALLKKGFRYSTSSAFSSNVATTSETGPYDLSTATYDSVALDVTAQEDRSYDFTFNDDGTVLYVLGSDDDEINEYTLSNPYDVSSASFEGIALDVTAQESSPYAMIFNGDGTSLYLTGHSGYDVNEYTLSTPYDISTASFDSVVLDLDPNEYFPTDLLFNDDGTELFVVGSGDDDISIYSLSTAYDISSASYSTSSVSVFNPVSAIFNYDGTVLYVLTNSSNISKYALESPYNISTSTYLGDDLDVSAQESTPQAMALNPAGTSLYVLGWDDDFYEYTMPTVATGTFASAVSDLNSNTTYYAQAYAENLVGRTYAASSTFTTTAAPPAIVATAASSLSSSSATLNGDVTSLGDDTEVTVRGFRYSTSSDFSVAGVATSSESGSFSTGTFTAAVAGLAINTAYYFQSFAENTFGPNYSRVKAFKTSPVLPAISIATTSATTSNSATIHAVITDDGGLVATRGFRYGTSSDFTGNSATTSTKGPHNLESATFEEIALDFSAEVTNPRSMLFADGGVTLYILSNSANGDIYEYTLSTAYDISTATSSGLALTLFPDVSSAMDMLFSDDGTTLYVLSDGVSDSIYEYTLSVPYDISTATYVGEAYDISGQEAYPGTIHFNGDGTSLYLTGYLFKAVNEYALSVAYDISTATSSGVATSLLEVNTFKDLVVANEGNVMYVLDSASGAGSINEYEMSTAYDVSTASYVGEYLNVLGQELLPENLLLSPDGTQLYISGGSDSDVNKYTMSPFTVGGYSLPVTGLEADSTYYVQAFAENSAGIVRGASSSFSTAGPPSVTTGAASGVGAYSATLNGSVTSVDGIMLYDRGFKYATSADMSSNVVTVSETGPFDVSAAVFNSVALDVSSQETVPTSMLFNDDGTSLYVMGISGDDINKYTLSTAYDISTATFDSIALDVSGQENAPQDMMFNDDGSVLYVTGGSGDDINKYTLSTAYDISTATFDSIALDVSGQETDPDAMLFNGDGTRLYLLGSGEQDISEYTVHVPYDISSSTFSSVVLSVSAVDTAPEDMIFNFDGTQLYMVGLQNDSIYHYELSTPYDVSTAVYQGVALNVSSQEAQPNNLLFNNNGTSLFVGGISGDDINEYTLSTISPEIGAYSLPTNTLEPSTTYYVQAFAKNVVGAANGATTSFTTSLEPPTATTSAVTSIGSSSATFNGNIITLGQAAVTRRGFEYSTSSSFTSGVATTSESGSFATGTFSTSVTGLASLTTYYVRSFAENAGGVGYSTTTSFQTLQRLAVLTTDAPTSVGTSSATFVATVTEDGGYLLKRGFVYSTSSDFSSNVATRTLNAYDISTMTFSEIALNVDETIFPTAMVFNDTGTSLFVLDRSARDVTEYTLSTPYDVSSASYDSIALSTIGQDTDPFGMSYDDTGDTLYVVGNAGDRIHEYALNVPYDIGSSTYNTVALIVSSEDTTPYDILFNDDGSSLYLLGSASDDITEYTLSTEYDPSSAASNSVALSVGAQDTVPLSIIFNDDGTSLYYLGYSGDDIFAYTLSTPYDISTATYDGVVLDVTAQETEPTALLFNDDGTTLYVLGASGDDIGTYLTPTSTIGAFDVNVNNLLPGTTYYVKSYASNEAGTSFGVAQSFTTDFLASLSTSTISNHTSGQVDNAFDSSSETNAPLFAFNLSTTATTATATQIVIDVTGIKNINLSDITNLRLYSDDDDDAKYDASDTLLATGTSTDNISWGTIIFSTDIAISTAANYLVVADWSAPPNRSLLTLSFNTSDIDVLDFVGSQPIVGTIDSVQHSSYRAGGGGGSVSIGIPAPPGAGIETGGTNEGGQTIGDDPDYKVASTQSGSWTGGVNAIDETDGTYATDNTGVTHDFSNHGFSIPGGNTIDGIIVRLEVSAVTGTGTIDVALSWNGGSSWTSDIATPELTNTDAVVSVGGASNLWGRSWSQSEFSDGNFVIRVTGVPDGNTVQIDALQVRVFSSSSGGGSGGGGAI